VRPEHRGTGLVDAMLDAAATWARALGLPALTLDVHDENRRAQAAYRRAGFVPTGERFVGRIGPEIVMARPLQ
jgi:ribosomal protein S18 acetylase RimI-like enzyme